MFVVFLSGGISCSKFCLVFLFFSLYFLWLGHKTYFFGADAYQRVVGALLVFLILL